MDHNTTAATGIDGARVATAATLRRIADKVESGEIPLADLLNIDGELCALLEPYFIGITTAAISNLKVIRAPH